MKVAISLSFVLAFMASAKAANLDDVRFILYTRSNPNIGVEISHNLGNLGSTNFDSSKQTYFLIHGWNSGINFAIPFKDGNLLIH